MSEQERALDLWTVGDICTALDINRATLWRWRQDDSFPKPVLTFTGRGGLWEPEPVRAWERERRHRRGYMRGAAVGRYRQTHNMAQVARELGKSPATIKGWLIELGEYPPPE